MRSLRIYSSRIPVAAKNRSDFTGKITGNTATRFRVAKDLPEKSSRPPGASAPSGHFSTFTRRHRPSFIKDQDGGRRYVPRDRSPTENFHDEKPEKFGTGNGVHARGDFPFTALF
jgi:hypothetical protein